MKMVHLTIHNHIDPAPYLNALGFSDSEKAVERPGIIREFDRVAAELRDALDPVSCPMELEIVGPPFGWRVKIQRCCWWRRPQIWWRLRAFRREYQKRVMQNFERMLESEGKSLDDLEWRTFQGSSRGGEK